MLAEREATDRKWRCARGPGVAVEAALNVAPCSEANTKVPTVAVPDGSGPELIAVSGAVVSGGVTTVQLRVAGVGSVLPAASVARTAKLCAPTARSA